MIKILGCIVIVLSCSGLGYMAGSRLNMRVRELKLLKVSLQMLETEISYSNTPLPTALDIVAHKSSHPVECIFRSAAYMMKERKFSSAGQVFQAALHECRDKLSMTNEDMEILKSFGYTLGSSDTLNQIKNFNMVIKQIEAQETKAEESRRKNEKMYKSLGFLSGLAITVILL